MAVPAVLLRANTIGVGELEAEAMPLMLISQKTVYCVAEPPTQKLKACPVVNEVVSATAAGVNTGCELILRAMMQSSHQLMSLFALCFILRLLC